MVEKITWRTKHQIPTLRNEFLQESRTIKRHDVSGNSLCWKPWGPYPKYPSHFLLRYRKYHHIHIHAEKSYHTFDIYYIIHSMRIVIGLENGWNMFRLLTVVLTVVLFACRLTWSWPQSRGSSHHYIIWYGRILFYGVHASTVSPYISWICGLWGLQRWEAEPA